MIRNKAPTFLIARALCRSDPGQSSSEVAGQVVDAVTLKPIEVAWLVSGNEAVPSNRDCRFSFQNIGTWVGARATGYARQQFAARPDMQLALSPPQVRGLYLSFCGVGLQVLRDRIVETASKKHLNAIVVDVKGDNGFVRSPATELLFRKHEGGRHTVTGFGQLTTECH